MSRTTTRDIIKVCAELARMDRKAKIEIMQYLSNELAATTPEPKQEEKPETCVSVKMVRLPATYTEGGE